MIVLHYQYKSVKDRLHFIRCARAVFRPPPKEGWAEGRYEARYPDCTDLLRDYGVDQLAEAGFDFRLVQRP